MLSAHQTRALPLADSEAEKESRFARGHTDLGPGSPPHPRKHPISDPAATHPGWLDVPFALNEHIMGDRWGGPRRPWLHAIHEPWPGLPISVTGGSETGSQMSFSEPAASLPAAQLPPCLLEACPHPRCRHRVTAPGVPPSPPGRSLPQRTWPLSIPMAFVGDLLCARHG